MKAQLQVWARIVGLWLVKWAGPVEPVKPLPCPTCGAPWTAHICPYVVLVPGDRVCGICAVELPVGAVRTHDGKFRCKAHKAVEVV